MASAKGKGKDPQTTIAEGKSQNVTVSLHPLVVVNISDHYTRARVQEEIENPRVIGALLGTQSGRNVEIFNSFELLYTIIEGIPVIDTDYLKQKQEQFNLVFKDYDFLGWYSTGNNVDVTDVVVHSSLLTFNENPLYLLLDPIAAKKGAKDLPVSIFESEMHVIDDKPTLMFAKVTYKVDTVEAERISVDHVAKVAPDSADSQLVHHMSAMKRAIEMMERRMNVIRAFVEATLSGEIPTDHRILRKIVSLINSLPAINSPAFSKEFIMDYNDTLLLTQLATMTKGIDSANTLADTLSVLSQRGGGHHAKRMRHFMMH